MNTDIWELLFCLKNFKLWKLNCSYGKVSKTLKYPLPTIKSKEFSLKNFSNFEKSKHFKKPFVKSSALP